MKVKLLKPHTHAGGDFAPGDVIEVNERQAAWLKGSGIAETDKTPAPGPAKEKGGK
jgi:hypothetical protein